VSITTRLNGTKRTAQRVIGLVGGSKTLAIDGFVLRRDTGVKVPVFAYGGPPDNMVLLFRYAADADPEAAQCDGLNGTVDYHNDAFLRAYYTSGTAGGIGGSDTHDGDVHGTDVWYSYYADNINDVNKQTLFASCYFMSNTRHNHSDSTASNHDHPSTETHAALKRIVLPYQFGRSIPAGSLWLRDDDTVPTGFSDYSSTFGNGRFLCTGTAWGTGGAVNHIHDAVDLNLTKYIKTVSVESYCRGDYLTSRHSHTVESYMPAASSDYQYRNYRILVLNTDYATIDDLPVGTIGFFINDDLPAGWTEYDKTSSRYIRITTSTPGGTGGASTHTHGVNTVASNWRMYDTTTYECNRNRSDGHSQHNATGASHTMYNEEHESSGTNRGRDQTILLAKKTLA
jgi:hypothetical protein